MRNSYNKIRHIQESNMLLEHRRFNQLLESKMGNVKPIITEAESAQDIAKKARAGGFGTASQDDLDKIVSCITNNKLESLNFLTAAGGVGVLTMVGPLIITAGFGIVPIAYLLKELGYPNVVTDEIERLVDCVSK